jgi:DNA repair exonuclease SbcCD ATPase subunit
VIKLELQKVILKNFFSFGSQAQEIDFLPGVNLILGHDEGTGRSNGSGKSSFVESVPFALYGQTHKNVKKEQIVNWRSRRNCEVQLSFRKGENDYNIIRGISPDKFEIYEDGTMIPRPAHVRDYQQMLENEILGLNFQTFMSLIHSNLNSSSPILAMKKPEKRKFMEKVFGLELYTKLNDICNKKSRVLGEKIRECDLIATHELRSISDARDKIHQLNEKKRIFTSSRTKLNDARENLVDLEDKWGNVSEDLRELKDQILALETKADYYNTILKTATHKRDMIKIKHTHSVDRVIELEEKEEVSLSIIEKSKKLQDFIDKHGEIEYFDERISSLKKVKIVTESRINEHDVLESNYQKRYHECNAELKSEQAKLNLLEDEYFCPTCGQGVSGDTGNRIKTEISRKIANLEFDKTISRDSLNEIGSIIDCDKEELSNTINSISTADEIKLRIYQLKSEIPSESIEGDDSRKEQFIRDSKRYNGVINKLTELVEYLTIYLNHIYSDINPLANEEIELKHKAEQIGQKKSDLKRLEERVEIEQQNYDELAKLISSYRDSINESHKSIGMSKSKDEKFKGMVDYMDFIKVLCKDEEVKQYAISSIMPHLNKQTNHYLSEVGYSFYTIFDKWLDAQIKGPGITKGSYGSLSGGEGRGIDLSLQLAFLDIARVQAGSFPDMIVFDELLDSSVDEHGIGRLMDIVQTKQQEDPMSKIFIISHRTELGDFDADYTYHVERTGGYSKVSIS